MDLFTCSLACLAHFPCLGSGWKRDEVHHKYYTFLHILWDSLTSVILCSRQMCSLHLHGKTIGTLLPRRQTVNPSYQATQCTPEERYLHLQPWFVHVIWKYHISSSFSFQYKMLPKCTHTVSLVTNGMFPQGCTLRDKYGRKPSPQNCLHHFYFK